MKSFAKFLLFVLLITLALAGLYAWKSGHPAAAAPPAVISSGTDTSDTTGTAGPAPVLDPRSIPRLAALDEELSNVAGAVIPSVVSLTARKTNAADPRDQFLWQLFGLGQPPAQETTPMGSGVIVSREGHIVTNNHVIQGAGKIDVQLSDGRGFEARVLGADPRSDIAVLKIEADGLQPLPFADSSKVKVGQLVFAIGNPFGLQETVTQGIVSARGRLFSSEAANEFFQTDTAINPGNSGGPLVNIRGEIIGINNFILSQSGGSQGIGFAIPSNTARRIMEQLIEHGRVLRPFLGVVLQPMDARIARQLGLPDARGALVEMVGRGSPAELAGLQRGDVVRRFAGREVGDYNDLRKFVAESKIGGEVPIEVIRGGRPVNLTVRITDQPSPRGVALPQPPAPGPVVPPLPPAAAPPPTAPSRPAPAAAGALRGISTGELTPDLIRRLDLPENITGAVVTRILPGSPVDGLLRPGDVIEKVNDTPVDSPAAFATAVAALPPAETAVVYFARGRTRSFEMVSP